MIAITPPPDALRREPVDRRYRGHATARMEARPRALASGSSQAWLLGDVTPERFHESILSFMPHLVEVVPSPSNFAIRLPVD